MFDGEEVNEAEESKDRNMGEWVTCIGDAPSQDDENKKTDEIELDVLNAPENGNNEVNEDEGHCSEEPMCGNNDEGASLEENLSKTILEVANDALMKDGEKFTSKQKIDEDEKVNLSLSNHYNLLKCCFE